MDYKKLWLELIEVLERDVREKGLKLFSRFLTATISLIAGIIGTGLVIWGIFKRDLDDRSGYVVEALYDRDEIIEEWIKTWMGIISGKGYTKQRFPIEKLKAWLEKNGSFWSREKYASLYREVLAKIEELEDE